LAEEAVVIHFLLVQLGSPDLLTLALASIERFAGDCNVDIVKLPDNTNDPRAHGQAVDDWKKFQKFGVVDKDVVVLMDTDVVLLSEQWRVELDAAFADPHVGVWGAGAQEDFGPRVHASMMAIRGSIFNSLERSFTPCVDLREQTWRDTGGLYCMWVHDAGYEVRPVERGVDWAGAAAWWGMHEYPALDAIWGAQVRQPVPLWSHLGGGTHSDPARLTWWERCKRHRALRQRRRWSEAAKVLLRS
jgi:hypothetical protein